MKQSGKLWRILLGGVVAASMAGLPGLSMAADMAEATYVSGGIGDDDPMIASKADYNLHLVFAQQGSGEYLADVDVFIENSKGDKVVNAKSSGPLFYVDLPAGRYRVTASFDGKSLSKTTTVRNKGGSDLHFYWQ